MSFWRPLFQKKIALFLVIQLVLPILFIVIVAVPASAAELTKKDAYTGLGIALVLIIIAKLARTVFADPGEKNAGNQNQSDPDDGTSGNNSGYMGYTKDDLELLARVIYAESRGEPYEGQIAVGAVVLNRVESDQFPDTIREVIYAPGQFSSVEDGQINLIPNEIAYQAAREALEGKDPCYGALFFYNPEKAPNNKFFQGRKVIVKIGDHVFTE